MWKAEKAYLSRFGLAGGSKIPGDTHIYIMGVKSQTRIHIESHGRGSSPFAQCKHLWGLPGKKSFWKGSKFISTEQPRVSPGDSVWLQQTKLCGIKGLKSSFYSSRIQPDPDGLGYSLFFKPQPIKASVPELNHRKIWKRISSSSLFIYLCSSFISYLCFYIEFPKSIIKSCLKFFFFLLRLVEASNLFLVSKKIEKTMCIYIYISDVTFGLE